ncbi:DUF2378 family protein [Archangium sp.]|jgi:uncharacterized protein (TIGR02265 family)|uniref:DUF2378 family protein n=1 Tax=Archangium sp. TaxID=1872627 RepID=UPI002ED916F8
MSDDTEVDSGSGYDAEQDLAQRLFLATPEHTTRGILFMATLRTLRELGVDEAMVQRCLEASGETEFVEFFNYPTSSLLRLLEAAARALCPKYGSVEESLRQIGWMSGDIYMASKVGRSAQQLMGGADPMQWVRALQALYKVVMAYSEPSVIWMGPKRGILAVQRTFTPLPYHEGGALSIAARLGVQNVKVRARRTGDLSIELAFSWE